MGPSLDETLLDTGRQALELACCMQAATEHAMQLLLQVYWLWGGVNLTWQIPNHAASVSCLLLMGELVQEGAMQWQE